MTPDDASVTLASKHPLSELLAQIAVDDTRERVAALLGILIGVIAVMLVWGALFGLANAVLALLSHLGWV